MTSPVPSLRATFRITSPLKKFDVVVIGGGHAGTEAAAAAARSKS